MLIIHCYLLQKIFPEAAAAASGKKLEDGSGLSSDDSEDEEYDPDKPDSPEKVEGDKSSSDESSYLSAPEDMATSNNNEKYLGLPSDDSEDDDFDPSDTDQGQVKQDSSSSDFTSDSEDLEALIEDETTPSEDPLQASSTGHLKQTSVDCNEEISNVGRKKRRSLKDELSYLVEADVEPLSSKRHVERLDYKKLNDVSILFSHFYVLHAFAHHLMFPVCCGPLFKVACICIPFPVDFMAITSYNGIVLDLLWLGRAYISWYET